MTSILKTSEQWQDEIKEFCLVMDPDGWRNSDAPDWNTMPITKAEFIQRMNISTLQYLDKNKFNTWSAGVVG
jgi:hypothetical protein